MPGYPKSDPYNPGKLIHSYKIPPERQMSKEQRKLIDKKIQHPNLPRFKRELNKLADEMVETSFVTRPFGMSEQKEFAILILTRVAEIAPKFQEAVEKWLG